MRKSLIGLLLALAAGTVGAQELVLRHSLEGRALDTLSTLTLKFNEAQKGKAKVTLQGLSSVEDRRHLPAMALMHPDDAINFFDTLPRYLPLAKVMSDGGEKFDGKRFYPQIADAVDDSAGKLLALPVGLSVPVILWNKDAFAKAGLNPDVAPKTWPEVQAAAVKLFESEVACPITSSRFAWVHVENASAQANEPIMVKPSRVALNSLINVKHLALMASWNKGLLFYYYGARNEADGQFLSGKCAMITGESSLYAEALGRKLNVGVGALPYYDDVYGAQQANVMPQGASLWFLAGLSKPESKVAAKFVSYLMQTDTQRAWVRGTGYLPMTPDAVQALREGGAPKSLMDSVEKRLSAAKSAHPRADGAWARVYQLVNGEVESVWRGEKPAKAALDAAMQQVNGPVKTK